MSRISRITAVLTLTALAVHGLAPALAATEVSIEGTVEVPCDPSRLSEVAFVQIREVASGSVTTVGVDPSTGKFVGSGLTEGEHELVTLGDDGRPMSPEATRLVLADGPNRVLLSMKPAGCGEPDADGDGIANDTDLCPDTPAGTAVAADGCPMEGQNKTGGKQGLKDWEITLIFFGVVTAIVLALSLDDEEPASPF